MSGRAQGFLRNLPVSARALRLLMNVWPPYVGAGIRVEHIAADFRSARVRMRLRWYNRNYFGTHFGGSLYAMTDPFFALLMMHNLGKGYVVWDKGAAIRYRLPAKGTVRAHFVIGEAEIAAARRQTASGDKHEPTFTVEVTNERGEVIATVDKTLYVRRQEVAPAAY